MRERRPYVMMLNIAFLTGLMLYNPYGCVEVFSFHGCV